MHSDRKKWKVMEVTWATPWLQHKDSVSCYSIELDHLNVLFVMSLSTYKASGIWKRSMSFHHFVSRQASNCKIHKQSLWTCMIIINFSESQIIGKYLCIIWYFYFQKTYEKKFLYFKQSIYCTPIITSIRRVLQSPYMSPYAQVL